jgi:hypothetical protein
LEDWEERGNVEGFQGFGCAGVIPTEEAYIPGEIFFDKKK